MSLPVRPSYIQCPRPWCVRKNSKISPFLKVVIPTAVKRARAFFSARVGRRDLVVPQHLDSACSTLRSLAPIRTLKKTRPHDGARDDVAFGLRLILLTLRTKGLLHPVARQHPGHFRESHGKLSYPLRSL